MLPLVPLLDATKALNEKPFIGLSKLLVLDGLTLTKEEIQDFTDKQEAFGQRVSVLVGKNKFSDDDLISLLNNGISTLFVEDLEYANHLLEIGIPDIRLSLFKENAFRVKFGQVQEVSWSQLVKVSEITKQSFTNAILKGLKTDRSDGLYTTLVVDENERSLGLVYSSKESIAQAVESQTGVYFSRSRNEIWRKGATSGNVQQLLSIDLDCDGDALKFVVRQGGSGSFCHLNTQSCFGDFKNGLYGLQKLLQDRLVNAPEGSYTKRLFNDPDLLDAKIKEEAEEVTEAKEKKDIAWECADLFYFTLVKLVASGVSLEDVENNLNMKHLKVTRRKGDAKPKFIKKEEPITETPYETSEEEKIFLNVVSSSNKAAVEQAVTRPIQKTAEIMNLVKPIIDNVVKNGDKALIELTAKFDGVDLKSPVLEAPFPPEYLEGLTDELREALDLSIENVRKFHAAQMQTETLEVETQPGVVCSRFPRPIEKVGLYIPGGTAILPSTALMLGVPAQVAGCKEIVFASPPRKSDGRVSPEVVYVASKVGASKIVLAGGAQAVAAMAYGTETVPKVDKILGPGNQFVTAAKMHIQNDTQALCSIDMPAGPSEVLVICDEEADVDYVASDLLSQAEHGIDSQVILVGVSLSETKIEALQNAVHEQAMKLPRVDIVRKCIAHSSIILCESYEDAFKMSNQYAPEHLILQISNAQDYVKLVDHAGSVFVGAYTPESCGDYSSGTNHTLPTYGYARQYSGVNTSTFQKFITSQSVSPTGLENIGRAVMSIAAVEGLDAHRNAVKIRMTKLGLLPPNFE
ncbi:histidine biosynthesis trifunctional protein [Kluyveromyces marxianus DMKU3-1042]|uniref:Histidine biosynthesis trifunctional protein n=1 Tax=Kluyveromyces marxianus (strain DMKU3-1042 / BCC 29191 / NBRC 104275) TaxID=1003335 RepID=W0T294_KLUMD|nr:histidine biosynthesis trifunctional protein [Kluyveromyces marxianus DMKU3-1042]BAO37687.1 histidine biosynthesis trifunctional protein [Kluyveromyces marxianus DMKU3-1042]